MVLGSKVYSFGKLVVHMFQLGGQQAPARTRARARAHARNIVAPLVVAVLFAASIAPLAAQSRRPAAPVTTGLHGNITTQGGAVYLPGVVVTVLDSTTGSAVAETTSDATGQYRIDALKPGTYTVRAVLDGFAEAMKQAVQVTAGRDVEVSLDLTIAKIAESVSVEAGRRDLPLEASRTMTTANGASLEIGPIKGDN